MPKRTSLSKKDTNMAHDTRASDNVALETVSEAVSDVEIEEIPATGKWDPWAHLPLASDALKRWPPTVCQKILEMMAEGKGHKPIAAYLRTVGVTLSERQIAKILAVERNARAPMAKSIVRERLAEGINEDLDVLDKVLEDLVNLAEQHKKTKSDHGMYLKFVDRIKAVVDTRLHYSGADAKPEVDTDDAAERVVDRINALLKGEPMPQQPEIEVKLVEEGQEGDEERTEEDT